MSRPFFARLLLKLALPEDEHAWIVDDLDESVQHLYPRGRFRAWLWYWRQALSFSSLFMLERIREDGPPRPPRLRKEGLMGGLSRDVSFAFRQLVKHPGFTVALVLTLALGIGPNTAIFSVVNGVLLQPLPYSDPDRLTLMRIDLSGLRQHPGIAHAEVVDFRERSTLLEDVGAVSREFTASLTAQGNMEAVLAANVTPNMFPMLGVNAALGRLFTIEEGIPDTSAQGPSAALLSYGLWQRRYGGDPEVIGKTIEVNNASVPIVGVVPRGFQLLLGPGTSLSPDIDLWTPMRLDRDFRGFWAFRAIAKMKPDVTIAQAEAEVQAIGAQLVTEYPQAYENSNIQFYLHPLHRDLVQHARPAILTLLGAVSLVLLIACINAAGLMVARMKAREKEMALRAALGAGRGRLMREVFIESSLVAVAAGGVGLALGTIGLRTLLSLQPGNLPRVAHITLDRPVLAFTLGASFLAAVLLGMLPAWQASRPDIQQTLKEGQRTAGDIRARTRGALVVAQVAFSLMLLVGAGLLIRSFISLRQVDLGFQPERVITMRAPLDGRQFNRDSRWPIYQQLLDGIRGLPGVTAAGGVSLVPLGNQGMMASYTTDQAVSSDWSGVSADYRWILPGYFDAMGVRLVAGRFFEEGDNMEPLGRVVVDETLAEQAWAGENPVGKQMFLGMGSALDTNVVRVIGVVAHSRIITVRDVVRPQIYMPYRTGPSTNMVLTVRAQTDPTALVAAIRRESQRVGTGRPIHSVRTMESYVESAMGGARFTLILMGILATIALLLSTVGIYSVIAFLARQRAHETGVRMALGAQRADIIKMNVRNGFLLAALGVPIGLAGAFALSRFIDNLLFGVAATDPITFVGIPIVLIAVAMLASYIPARRASRVDPLVALREQ